MRMTSEQNTIAMRKDFSISTQTSKDQVARRYPRYRSPEEGRDAKHTYSFEVDSAMMDGHVARMPDERLPKKIFLGELQV